MGRQQVLQARDFHPIVTREVWRVRQSTSYGPPTQLRPDTQGPMAHLYAVRHTLYMVDMGL